MKKFIFLLITFFSFNTFALDYNVTNIITSPGNGQSGYYRGGDPSEGTDNYHVNTRYYGRLQHIEFNIPKPDAIEGDCYWTNMTYKVTMNMATNDWRNNFGNVSVRAYNVNYATSRVNFVSKQKIYFTFKIPSSQTTCIDYVYVDLPSSEYGLRITGETNWNLSSIILSDSLSSSSGGSSSSPTPTPDVSQDIINNQNQNTQSVIENNTQNTSDIINNANQNTQDIINNQNQNTEKTNSLLGSCYKNLFNFKVYDNNNSEMTLNTSINGFNIVASSYYVSSNFTLSEFCPECRAGRTYYLKGNSSSSNSKYIYVGETWSYGTTKTLTESMLNSNVGFYGIQPAGSGTGIVSLSDIAIYEGSSNHPYGSFNEQICSSKLDDLQQEQNQNTQDIINNQNQNTQVEIESQKSCKTYSSSNYFVYGQLGSNGNLANSSSLFGTTDYIRIYSDTTIKVVRPATSSSVRYCFYNSSKSSISCSSSNIISVGSSLTIPDNATYFRFTSVFVSDTPIYDICNNGNQALNDSITDSNIDNDTGTGFFDTFNNEDFGLSQIVTIPLNTIQSLTSKTCSPLQVPIPFTNSYVSLPCMTEIYTSKFPSIYNLWKIVSFGIVAYFIAIDIFHIVKGFKDPESDKVEVLDL